MLVPYGGMYVAAGATVQALSTAAAQLTCWDLATGFNGHNSKTNDGDSAIIPDKAESRIKLQPGKYLVHLEVSGTASTAATITFQLRKAGVDITGAAGANTWLGSSAVNLTVFSAIIEITEADIDGTLATDSEPAGTFTGGGGYPKSLVALDVTAKASTGTPDLTVTTAHLSVVRVG